MRNIGVLLIPERAYGYLVFFYNVINFAESFRSKIQHFSANSYKIHVDEISIRKPLSVSLAISMFQHYVRQWGLHFLSF